MKTPSDYGLPSHITSWRPYQLESIDWCLNLTGIGLLESPTGSGKTGIAKAAASDQPALAVVKTKLLQQTVYREHGFAVLMGKSNYPCVNPEGKQDRRTVEQCLYRNAKMTECDWYRQCPYMAANWRLRSSQAGSINYAYYLATRSRYQSSSFKTIIYDECHLLPEITLDYVGVYVSNDDILKWRLSRPPVMVVDGTLDITGQNRPERALEWLKSLIPGLASQARTLNNREDKEGLDLARQINRLIAKVSKAVKELEINPLVWYINSDGEKFIAKPLTAKYNWPEIFTGFDRIVLMSGTIGDFDVLANELGIVEFDSMRVPSRFGPTQRPVYDLGAPKLSYKSGESDWNEQARLISTAIHSVPKDWDGVIHVTKKAHAQTLAEKLARNGLQDRVWVTPNVGTDRQVLAWQDHRKRMKGKKYPGQLAIAWAWQEGVDLREEKICISAKCLKEDVKLHSPNGPVGIDSIKEGQKLYTLDWDGTLIQTEVLDVMLFWYEGCMYHWAGYTYNVDVTAEHEMIVSIGGSGYCKVSMIDVPEIFNVRTYTDSMCELGIRYGKRIKKYPFKGYVWCVETEHETILAGRDGKYLWMGNCPFPDLSSPYEKARFEYSRKFYSQRTAWDLQQSLGRTRRGNDEDYDTEEEMRGLVCLADGNWKKVQKYLSPDFRDCIVSVE